jgi:hypothetical protein
MALPYGTTGSLCPSFLPDRLVSLTVKRAYIITLYAWLPIMLSAPLGASVTFLEATTPVKLPTKHCLPCRIRFQVNKGWYFKVGSTTPSDAASHPPTYPTHHLPKINVKLQ